MDLEDKEDEYRAQVARLQAEVASAVARLQAQGDSREQVGRELRSALVVFACLCVFGPAACRSTWFSVVKGQVLWRWEEGRPDTP